MQPARSQLTAPGSPGDTLEAIADLTARRDSHALANSLVDNLRRFIGADRIAIFGLCNDTNDREFNVANIETAVMRDLLEEDSEYRTAVVEDGDIHACIASRAPVVKHLATQQLRYVLPVAGLRDLTAVVVIESTPLDDATLDLAQYLLRIYSNQQILMGKGEFDALTGLLNRQAFDERMKKLMHGDTIIARHGGVSANMCLAILDIDYFKQVNDRYGHLFGDEVLLLFARLMTRSFRQCDMLFRYGGEEFAVVLGHDLQHSLIALERFRAAVAQFDFPQVGHKTVSIGVVELNRQELLSTIIDKADKALYYAKNNGRNQICAYETLRQAGLIGDAQKAGGEVELF